MAAVIEECSTSTRLEVGDSLPRLTALRKCASTPTLRTLGVPAGSLSDDSGLEVYVVVRSFEEFAGGLFNRLPGPLQEGVRDVGICHYMTVFKQHDGTLVQFDFGPKAGGDIHVGRGPLAMLLSKAPKRRRRNVVEGNVRENKLTSLPAAHMYVGRTPLSIGDIRAWNSVHVQTEYELHRSDCRHYVNSLVQYTTGVEAATSTALRHQWVSNRHRYGFASRVVQLGQFFTDVANWPTVKAIGQASMATFLTLTGRQAVNTVRAPGIFRAVQTKLLPVARTTLAPVRRAVSTRPVVMGTAAVATYAASNGQAPAAIKETVSLGARMAGGVQHAVRAAATLAHTVGRQATAATQRTTTQAFTIASGVAGAATRGAATMMQAKGRRAAHVNLLPGGQQVRPGGSSPRVTLGPPMKVDRGQHLAIVASRR